MEDKKKENEPESKDISTGTPTPPVQSEETPPRSVRQAQDNRLYKFINEHPLASWALTLFLATVFFLLVIVLFKWDVWNTIQSHWRICFGAVVGAILIPLGKALVDYFKLEKGEKLRPYSGPDGQDAQQEESEKRAPKGESWLVTAGNFITGVLTWGANNRLVRTVIVVAVIITGPSFLAHGLYEGVDVHIHFDGLGHIGEDAADQNAPDVDLGGDSAPDVGAADPAPPSLPEPEPPQEEEPEPAPFLLEPDRPYKLTDEETNTLFFTSGSYTITDWLSPAMIEEDEPPAESVSYDKITDRDSPGKIAEMIKPFIEDLCSQRVPNLFNDFAPESVRGEISDASAWQEEMTSSETLDRIIAVRSEVWEDYPRLGIADLLANNMQRYAQEYRKIGRYETVKYYQAQSIFWSFRSLAFSSDSSRKKDILNYISMRYHDIADMAANGSDDEVRATALSEAFKLLENMDLSSDRASGPEQIPEPEPILPAEDGPPLPQE